MPGRSRWRDFWARDPQTASTNGAGRPEEGGGLLKPSYVLTDHVRSIDKRRIRRTYGQVSAAELASVDQGLELFLGLNQT